MLGRKLTIKNAHQLIFEDTQYLKEVTNSVFGGLSDADADNHTPLVEQILPILDDAEVIEELKDFSSIFFTDKVYMNNLFCLLIFKLFS